MHEMKVRYSAVLEERHRISQDIHDTFTQNLAGIALQLDSLTMQLEEIPQSLRERLDEACNLTRYSLAEVRRAVGDLRSEELEREDLAVALPAIARRMSINSGIEPTVKVVGTPKRLSTVKEKNLLRIFQEALTNAIKHAHAQTVEVELRYEPENLVLQVQDDGRGFDTVRAHPLEIGHYGLTVMRERAERIGGRFMLRSALGEGTKLRIVVPFSLRDGKEETEL
jgi:signal transduction histidine kinase